MSDLMRTVSQPDLPEINYQPVAAESDSSKPSVVSAVDTGSGLEDDDIFDWLSTH